MSKSSYIAKIHSDLWHRYVFSLLTFSVLHVSPLQSLSKYVKVRVGSTKANEGGTLIDVVGTIRHPKYEQEPVPHADVALMKLAENLGKDKLLLNYIKNMLIIKGSLPQRF